jgi:NAD(P)-dependent dehydrogenase (short-subunit alcohol dehydrogenase family)
MFDLNVLGALATMQAVIPVMRGQQRGVIVNVSAGLSRRVISEFGPYASTKAALELLSATARIELVSEQIAVGLVLLGRTRTGFMDHAARGRSPTLGSQQLPAEDTVSKLQQPFWSPSRARPPRRMQRALRHAPECGRRYSAGRRMIHILPAAVINLGCLGAWVINMLHSRTRTPAFVKLIAQAT